MNKTKLIALLALGAVSASASADLIIDEKVSSVKTTKKVKQQGRTQNKITTATYSKKTSTFDHVGQKEKTEKLKGFSNDVTVRQALEQLVPEDWTINVNKAVDLEKKVSFAGGKTWNDTVETVGKDNFSANFDWNKKVINVYPTSQTFEKKVVATTEDVAEYTTAPSVKNLPKAVTSKVRKTPVVQKRVQKTVKPVAVKKADTSYSTEGTWKLQKNLTLKQNIENWAKKAGWTVAWRAPDYSVIADATLTGAIDSENGPIISILKLYQDSNLPLRVNIMGGNKVINVESRNYIPQNGLDVNADWQWQ